MALVVLSHGAGSVRSDAPSIVLLFDILFAILLAISILELPLRRGKKDYNVRSLVLTRFVKLRCFTGTVED